MAPVGKWAKLCKVHYLRIADLGTPHSMWISLGQDLNGRFSLADKQRLLAQRMPAIRHSRALTHCRATRQKAFGVYIFGCYRLGQADVGGFRLPQPII